MDNDITEAEILLILKHADGLLQFMLDNLTFLVDASVEKKDRVWPLTVCPHPSDAPGRFRRKRGRIRERRIGMALLEWSTTSRPLWVPEGHVPSIGGSEENPLTCPMPQAIGWLVRLGWAEAFWDDEGMAWLVSPTPRGIEIFLIYSDTVPKTGE